MERLVLAATAMDGQELLRLLIGLPDGAQAGGFGSHHIDAVAEVDGQRGDAGAGKLQNTVFHKALFKGGLYQGDGDVVGTDAAGRLTGEIDQHHFRIVQIPGVFQQLLTQFRTTLAYGHGT